MGGYGGRIDTYADVVLLSGAESAVACGRIASVEELKTRSCPEEHEDEPAYFSSNISEPLMLVSDNGGSGCPTRDVHKYSQHHLDISGHPLCFHTSGLHGHQANAWRTHGFLSASCSRPLMVEDSQRSI